MPSAMAGELWKGRDATRSLVCFEPVITDMYVGVCGIVRSTIFKGWELS